MLRLNECSARPYAELIRSGIAGPSNFKRARPAALRPSPPSSKKVSPIGPSAATPTQGEVLDQLETLSRKPRSVKRKKSGFAEKDRPALAKVPRLGASSSSQSVHAQNSERVQSPAADAPIFLSSQPPSTSVAKTKKSFGWTRRTAIGGCAHHRLESADRESQVAPSPGGRVEKESSGNENQRRWGLLAS